MSIVFWVSVPNYPSNTYGRISELWNLLKIALLGKTLFYRLQNKCFFPVITKHYELSRTSSFTLMKSLDKVDLAGNGRCEAPGYNAKYGTYTFMILPTTQIINFKVTQVSQVSSSTALEKYGFIQALQEIENEVRVSSITTDCHVQIKEYLKGRPDITHQSDHGLSSLWFDIWHVAKSIKKKLCKHFKKFPELSPWVRSILNHFCWSCGACAGDVILLRQKMVQYYVPCNKIGIPGRETKHFIRAVIRKCLVLILMT